MTIDTTIATTARNTTLTSMLATIASAASGPASRAARARFHASTPSTATGITLSSSEITSSRTRTGSRGTPRTSVTPPSGKNCGNCRRH